MQAAPGLLPHPETLQIRAVREICRALQTIEGAGLPVHRAFPLARHDQIDPFLLLDRFGPFELLPGRAKGMPTHPHRGFEILTYLISGSLDHRDSEGREGRLQSGDLQWMRAGSGILHNEWPSPEFQETGGTAHGVQLWINLPASRKMAPPALRDIPACDIPVWDHPFGRARVKVLAGTFSLGGRSWTGPAATETPVLFLHVGLGPNGQVEIPVTPGHAGLVYGMAGTLWAGAERAAVGDNEMALLDEGGDRIYLSNPGNDCVEALVLAGAPLREPMARRDPFVMNTESELEEAMRDYRQGRFGWLADP